MTTVTRDQLAEASPRTPMMRVANLLGCTEGQAYTVVLGLVLAVVAALVGLPPTLRDRGEAIASPSLDTGVSGSDAPPAEDGPGAAAADTAPVSGADTASEGTGPTGGVAGAGAEGAAAAPGVAAPAPPGAGAAPAPPASAVAPSGFGAADVAARVADPGAPDGVTVDAAGRIYVTTNNGGLRGEQGASQVLRYSPAGRLERRLTVKGQDATRTAGLTGVVVAPDGAVLALDSAPARVLRLDLDGGRQATRATLADLPPCAPAAAAKGCEPGADDAPRPRALALDRAGNLFVTDSGQQVIWRVPPRGRAQPWYVFADPDESGPTGITLDGAGAVLVVTSMAVQGANGAGQVQRIAVRPDGTAGRRATVATTDPLSGPAGLSTTPGGGIVVALSASDELVLFGPDGSERARLTAEQVAEQAGVPLDGPTGVVARGSSVLVTNQSPVANEASHWVVFDVPLTT